MNWIKEKPVFTDDCVLVVCDHYPSGPTYRVYQVKRIDNGEGSYMAWLDGDGDEYGDLGDLVAGLYCILPAH